MLKEHPFLVTTTFQGDGVTIKYEKDKKNRSDAVGKAFKLNGDGKGELVEDGDEIDGKVTAVEDGNKFTAAYIFGGLTFPLGDGETVARGDKIVGALGADNAKGHVKALPALSLPDDLDDIAAAPTQADHNAARQAINDLKADVAELAGLKGKGSVLDSDTTHALVALGA